MEEQNPYRSPNAVIAEPAGEELASRWVRLGAAFIDGIIMLVILMPIMYFGGYWRAATEAAAAGQQVGLGTTLLWGAVGFIVFLVVQGVPLNATGQTWGKRITGIKIVDLAGNKPPLGKLIGLRYLPIGVASNIPFIGPIISIVNVLLIFRADRRCGHDLIAGTRVVKAG